MIYRIIAIVTGMFILAGTASAQTATPSASPTATSTPSAQTSSQALENESSSEDEYNAAYKPNFAIKSTAPLVWLRFRRFLSFNPVKDSELTLAISNRLLTEAREQENTNPTKAASTLENYARETKALQSLTDTIMSQSQNQQATAFLNTFLADKTTQLTLLDATNPNAASELSKKISSTRAATLRDIVKTLEKPNLSDAERQKKLDLVIKKYAEKESQINDKIASKLSIKDEIDDETDDEGLEEDLASSEDEALEEAANSLDKDELTDFANELRRKEGDQSLVVLQKLLGTVPDSAKSGIETAIDAVIARQITTFNEDPSSIEQLLNEHSGSSKIRTLLLDRIKEQADDENLKQQIELIKAKPAERVKKSKELQKEAEKKAKEKAKEIQKKETKSPEAKSSEKPEVKSSASPEIKTEATSVEVKVKEDGTLDKTSYTVKKGSLVTIKVESATTNSVTVNFSNSLGSVTVSKESKKSLSPFTISETVSFTANGSTGYIYAQ